MLLGDTLEAQGRDPATLPEPTRTLGSLVTSFVLNDCAQEEVRRSPLPEEPAHGDAVGPDPKRIRSLMAREAVCVEGDWADAAS